MELNILFPVLNEHLRLERGIRTTVEYVRAHLNVPCHLTILDNGSDDDTPRIGRKLAREYPEVTYERIEERGVGVAFRHGVELNNADIVGYMDIDLSTDISTLSEMLRIFRDNPQIQYVNASRFADRSDTRGRKWYRRITSKGLLILLKAVFGMRATDAICGFTFVRREIAERLVNECGDDKGWFYMIEFLLRAERDGIDILDLPVNWTEDYNTTVHIWKTIRNYLRNIIRLKRTFILEEKKNAQKN
ncbi:MAG: glycosyltransferase [Butyrivibrio sp.]|nr:glycosyltransferase [Butyrivibrio sp.]